MTFAEKYCATYGITADDFERTKLASLEESIATELRREFAGLPSKYGFQGRAYDFFRHPSA